MKDTYTIFYSWQNDTKCDNRGYIRECVRKAIDALKKQLGCNIIIDSDSRDEDGESSIDVAIMKKIAKCDFFVCDVTPVAELRPKDDVIKYIPNPNVMLELGYAINAVGWERCILVWNTKEGSQQNAPFDIRNHITKGFEYAEDMSPEELKEKGLHISSILKSKIEKYDDILQKQKSSRINKYDYGVYKYWASIAPLDDLKQSIDNFCNNIAYFDKDMRMWDQFQYEYRNSFEHRFLDQDLKDAIENLVKEIIEMSMYAATICDRNEVSTDYFKMRDFYRILDSKNALEEETKCLQKVREMYPRLVEAVKKYRMIIAEKFGE